MQKTSNITIAIIVLLAITIIVPDAYGQKRDVSKDTFENRFCDTILNDDKRQANEFQCIYFPEIWNWINELFSTTSELKTSMNNTIIQVSDHENRIQAIERQPSENKITDTIVTDVSDLDYRLQILEGKIQAPYVDLTVNVHPDKISKGEKFTISGEADRMEQPWVDFSFYSPDGKKIQTEWTNLEPTNRYFSDVIEPNYKWTMIGDYRIEAIHGPHIENTIIQYIG